MRADGMHVVRRTNNEVNVIDRDWQPIAIDH
jgi:hypothetical protein